MKRIFVAIGTLWLIVLFAACGQTTKTNTPSQQIEIPTLTVEEQPTETQDGYAVGPQKLDIPMGESIFGICVQNDRIYLLLQNLDTGDTHLCRYDPDGSLTELYALANAGSTFTVLDDGSIWYVGLDAQGDDIRGYTFTNTLCHMDEQGQLLAQVPGDEIKALIGLDDGGVLAVAYTQIQALDSTGQSMGTISLGSASLIATTRLTDGSIVSVCAPDMANGTARQLVRVNLETMALETLADLPDSMDCEEILGGSTENLLLRMSYSNIDSYNVLTQATKTALSWVDAGLSQSDVRYTAALQDTYIVAALENASSGSAAVQSLYIYPLGYTLKSADKITLRLAGAAIPDEVYMLVTAFNEENDQYYVELDDYSSGYDYQEGQERFLYDLNTGNLPDIILVSSDSDNSMAENLAKKGYIMDLDAWIEADETMQRSDFLENILDAVSVDGTLYTIPMLYNISTAGISTSIAGDITGYTLDDLNQWVEENPELDVMHYSGQIEFLNSALEADGQNLLDENDRLDTQALEALLTLARTLPEKYENEENFDGKNILVNCTELTVGFAVSWIDSRMGANGDFVMAGFPSASGDGNYITLRRQLAIAANTENAVGCWALLSYFLGYDYQHQNVGRVTSQLYDLPLRQDVLEEMEEYLLTKREYPQSWVDMTDTLLRTTDHVAAPAGMIDIVLEEASAYFAGDKTLDTAVQNIQSRVSIYLAEQG
jgi:ABC-type glycerol-3-phosphate transport system substrate-binding protein